MPPPYNEDDALAFNALIRDTYREANHEPDDAYPIWGDRAMYDYATGALSWDASCAKHLRECRAALGLDVLPIPPDPPPVVDMRLVRANFCNIYDSTGRPIFSSCLAGESPSVQDDWIACEKAAGGTHYILSIQTGYPGYSPVINFYTANRMDEWLTTLNRVLVAGLVPVVMLESGGPYPGTDYLRSLVASIPASYYDRCLWVAAWEPVKGDWTSRQYYEANLALREALGPTALMGCHLSPSRLSFSSNPPEADDPWQSDEMACWRDGWDRIGGHPFDVFLYQSPVPRTPFDATEPESWGERAKEVADRVLGNPGAPDWFAGIKRPILVWYEATAFTFIRGESTPAWAREVARSAQTLGYQGFGNGLP